MHPRDKYKVRIDANGQILKNIWEKARDEKSGKALRYQDGGMVQWPTDKWEPLRTKDIYEHFANKEFRQHMEKHRGEPNFKELPAAIVGGDKLPSSLIWVCAPDIANSEQVSFYTHVCKYKSVHHSTLAKGAGVIGAGEWIVTDGDLKALNGSSGHYMPSMSDLYDSLVCMRAVKMLKADTMVHIWDTLASGMQGARGQYVAMRALDIVGMPKSNVLQRYKAHKQEIR